MCGLTLWKAESSYLRMLPSERYSNERSGQLSFSQRLNSHIKYQLY